MRNESNRHPESFAPTATPARHPSPLIARKGGQGFSHPGNAAMLAVAKREKTVAMISTLAERSADRDSHPKNCESRSHMGAGENPAAGISFPPVPGARVTVALGFSSIIQTARKVWAEVTSAMALCRGRRFTQAGASPATSALDTHQRRCFAARVGGESTTRPAQSSLLARAGLGVAVYAISYRDILTHRQAVALGLKARTRARAK